jgi:hypothetical protein
MIATSGKEMIFGVAVGLFGTALLTSALAQRPATQFLGSRQTTTLNCAGGGVQIAGSNNKLILTGGCTMLGMIGSNNTATATLAKNASIQSPGGKKPQDLGSGNTLTPAH